MFGNRVTDFNQAAVGSKGYILKLDITELQASDVIAVQAQTDDSNTLAPSLREMSLTSLQMLLEHNSVLTTAFCILDNICYIFFNSEFFPYANGTRFIIDFVRGPKIASNDTDFLDISDRFISLVKLYALRQTYLIVKGQSPRNILDEIAREEIKLRKYE